MGGNQSDEAQWSDSGKSEVGTVNSRAEFVLNMLSYVLEKRSSFFDPCVKIVLDGRSETATDRLHVNVGLTRHPRLERK